MSSLKYFDGTNWNNVGGRIIGDTLPIGAIVPYGSTTAPSNWLVCDGSAVSRTTYNELFAIIGTKYGSGDGSTTFNLPNLKGKVPVGYDSNDSDFDNIGETGGEKKHALTENEMPSHYHDMFNNMYNYTTGGDPTAQAIVLATSNGTSPNVKTNNAGSGQAHNILQPYQVVCYIIKAKQSAGVVANVSNTYSVNQSDTYSCNYINEITGNGTTLYENNNGTTGDITLNDSITNYKKIDIYCAKGTQCQNICSFWSLAVNNSFTITSPSWGGNPFLQTVYHNYTITSATKLTGGYGGYVNISGGSVTQGEEYQLSVYKIIGYK